jgi:hypothetical protein
MCNLDNCSASKLVADVDIRAGRICGCGPDAGRDAHLDLVTACYI